LNEEIFLYTHLIVREDLWTLFGFPNTEELGLFKQILNISGLGGKSALGIVNRLSPAEIAGAVLNGDAKPFQTVPGIGKKTAQRIVLELKDKVEKMGIAPGAPSSRPAVKDQTPAGDNDAIAALCQLGYSAAESKKAVVTVLAEEPLLDSDALLRKALLRLSKF
jgi:Holliday junction DNA helicase RuvA